MQKRRFLLVTLAVAGVAVAAGFGATGTAAPSAMAVPQAADDSQARPTLTVRSSAYGRILFDGRGFALYAFTADGRGRSKCSGDCAEAWPPYIANGSLRAGSGVKARLLGTIRRADGRRQVTYNGKPLYYYVGDRRAGQVLCQNVFEFGGLWLVVRPSGRLVR
jgi:predicted lipoprotein with Yx(FWY)xxD motif